MTASRDIAPRRESAVTVAEAKHMMRFLRSERGEKPEDIARQEGVSVQIVEKSIRRVQIQKAMLSSDNTLEALRGIIVRNTNHASKAIANGLTAKKYVARDKRGKDGKVKTTYVAIPDIEAQTEAFKAFRGLAEAIQPKGGGISVNVKQNNQTAAMVTNVRGNGFEERLEMLRKRQEEFNQLPAEVAVSPAEDDDIIDAEEDDGDDEE